MRVRSLLIATAIVSALVGGVAAYLSLTVPNDLKADAMMKSARRDLEAGKRDAARAELSKIMQEYPRTDAAAAATVALSTLADQERKELEAEIKRMRDENAEHTKVLSNLQQSVEEMKNAPPKVVVQEAPKAAAKSSHKKKTTQHRRRHRR
ncbi:MAG TPA: hypothetical protein VF980_19085 [Thermoanaerobaculia bacterium]